MPFKQYLKNSIDFERTHQLILKTLLSDTNFVKHLTGVTIAEQAKVHLEPYSSLFDLGVFTKSEECLCLIELKMWSSLSKNQLDRQKSFLSKHQTVGLHILLGTTDLQYFKNEQYDEIADLTHNLSKKIGYKELINILDSYISENDSANTTVQMASDYKAALSSQEKYLINAWQNPKAHDHHRYYSTYSKIKNYLTDESFSIYTVNNHGGAVYILNDSNSWCGFKYKDYKFEIYQEILNNQLMLRIYSDGVSNDIRNEVKHKFLKKFKTTEYYTVGWDHAFRASKFHKVAVYNPKLENLTDCEAVARLLKSLNPVIKEIVRNLN